MELSIFEMYVMVKLSDIRIFLSLMAVAMIAIPMIYLWISWIEGKDVIKIIPLLLIPIAIVFITVSSLLPSTKQLAAIYIIPKIVNDERVQEIPQKILDLGLEWMDEMKPNNQP